jgi:hypothetical protein
LAAIDGGGNFFHAIADRNRRKLIDVLVAVTFRAGTGELL